MVKSVSGAYFFALWNTGRKTGNKETCLEKCWGQEGISVDSMAAGGPPLPGLNKGCAVRNKTFPDRKNKSLCSGS